MDAQRTNLTCAGSAQDSEQHVQNGSSEPHGSSGQEMGRVLGTCCNNTGEDSFLILKTPSLRNTSDRAAELTASFEPSEYQATHHCLQHTFPSLPTVLTISCAQKKWAFSPMLNCVLYRKLIDIA